MRIRDLRPGDRVKAFSLWEPWATLMATGDKEVETRGWPTSYRGPLLICAAKRRNKRELQELFRIAAFRSALDSVPLAHGKAVCLVNLSGCLPTHSFTPSSSEAPFGDYGPERYAWITSSLRRLKPFPVKGSQGLFEVTLPEFEDFER